jgi:Domain of unknown function (DUF3883)
VNQSRVALRAGLPPRSLSLRPLRDRLCSTLRSADRKARLEGWLRELEMERHCTIADMTHLGRAWVLPYPERTTPALAPMVRDEEIERIAIEAATRHEEARGCQVESVQSDNRGFDLISRRPHPEDSKTFIEVRFIEVKGRAGVGEIALTANEYKTAGRLKADYWLYAVFNCGGKPELHAIQDPARLGWVPVVQVEHYHVGPEAIRNAAGRPWRPSPPQLAVGFVW